MITITRSLARQLRAVFRQGCQLSARGSGPTVHFLAGSDGLRIRVQTAQAAIEYYEQQPHPPEQIHAPFELLAACEGRSRDSVKLETQTDNKVVAQWNEDGGPQIVQYDAESADGEFPAVPDEMTTNDPALLECLQYAMETVDRDATRYAVDAVQFRGNEGQLAATDGRQLLIQSGFEFPFNERVLVPFTTVFDSRHLPKDEPVSVGKSEDWSTFQVGSWTIHLPLVKEGRFPCVDDHIQDPADAACRLRIAPSDAELLIQLIGRLPNTDEFNNPVTVDLNGQVVLRSTAEDQKRPSELLLANSTYDGGPIRANTNRDYLSRAVGLGFRDVYFFGPEVPAQCQDERRTYVWALLGEEGAIPPSSQAIRIESTDGQKEPGPQKPSKRRKPQTTMSSTPTEPTQNDDADKNDGISTDALVEQAEALKTALREAQTKTTELIAGLKRHKKQAKLVQSTLAALRQLQDIAG